MAIGIGAIRVTQIFLLLSLKKENIQGGNIIMASSCISSILKTRENS